VEVEKETEGEEDDECSNEEKRMMDEWK